MEFMEEKFQEIYVLPEENKVYGRGPSVNIKKRITKHDYVEYHAITDSSYKYE